ncbi:MAG: 3'(2'),5'-bisphosphate nucleotidase CysQ [Bacteroidota bacterium]|nr:3'(2'),5'-bisphosphate nucleotidase CysQ [Bacteroidota bacterium]
MIENLAIDDLTQIAKTAGVRILEIYYDENRAQVSDVKDDHSPLTLADKAAHDYIAPALRKLYPELPQISEEGKGINYPVRSKWDYYWLIDPLDGTKEFLKRNGQFTVNIALMHKEKPVLGIIYAPVHDLLYYGGASLGSFKSIENKPMQPIYVNYKKDNLVVVKSKSHSSKEEDETLEKYPVADSIEVGSSLKFCMVAEGKADLYYRAGPTMEWDTAAGQAIVEGAGGNVYKNSGTEPFEYNKASLLNGSFLCVGW